MRVAIQRRGKRESTLAACGFLACAVAVGWIGLASEPERSEDREAGTVGSALADPENPIRKLFAGERLDLWSLRPIDAGGIPDAPLDRWSENPIDRYWWSEWSEQGLVPAGPSDRRALAHRTSLSLTGLRATFEEVESFVADPSPDAYERWIDRLLASPAYGEHAARQWLDVVRYSDSNGFDWDEFRKQAWRYRDYVVRAWNQDLPYDQFVLQQLAGDETVSGSPQCLSEQDALLATGYLRLGPYDNAAKLFDEQDRARAELLADLTETTASAFLGLTLACCRCHDHKTDPLSQADHYRFRAFFAAIKFADDFLMTDDPESADTISILMAGDHRSPKQVVEPGFPSVLDPNPPAIVIPDGGHTTGRRLALARWMVSPDNPWTARVLVNRLWQQHFGVGLVATANDFGLSGTPPSNPRLLDFLASELVRSGWSIKSLQRLIVNSQVYRQRTVPLGVMESKSGIRQASVRGKMHRLGAEALRDSILQASGELQNREGGPPVWPRLSEEILQANPAVLDDNETKTKGWYPSPDRDQSVRSLYLIQKRTLRLPWMETFDLPENTASCPKRETSIVPTQALALMNGELAVQAAGEIARRWRDAETMPGDESAYANYAFARVLGRLPRPEEVDAAVAFLNERSREEFALVLLNTNEFAFAP